MIFALFWGVWHIPLSFINDYYHSNLLETGWIHSVNFLVSLFPFVIIMNWLYYKTGRSILSAIIFHITAGYFNEIFATHPDSKVIQTALLTILAVIIVVKERRLFFDTLEISGDSILNCLANKQSHPISILSPESPTSLKVIKLKQAVFQYKVKGI